MTDNRTSERRCACHYTDAYDCWSSRYLYPTDKVQSAQEIEADGGPCQCECHDEHDQDCDPAEYL